MIRRGLAAAALLVLASCEPAFAATTWTVTNDATLSAANAGAVAGDTINVGAGTYTVGIFPRHNGTMAQRITYRGSMANPTAARVAGIDFRNGTGTYGNYITVAWIASSGDVGCSVNLSGGSYPYRGTDYDSLVKVSFTGNLKLYMRYSVFDSCSGSGNNYHLDPGIPANNTYETDHGITYMYPRNNVFKNGSLNWTNDQFNQASSGGIQFIHLVRTQDCTFYNNTFTFSATVGDGYFFAQESYFSSGNLFQNNVWNVTCANRYKGTLGVIGFRDSSSSNRLVGNTINFAANANARTMDFGLSEEGSFRDTSVRRIYLGNNVIRMTGGSYFGWEGWAKGDTLEFNTIAVDSGNAITNAKEFQDCVIRHNTFYSKTSGTVADFTSQPATNVNNRLASNVFYSGVSGNNTILKLPTTGVRIDSAGVFFNPGGTSASAISINGVTGAPASSGTYGLSGKSVWGSPMFQDSTSVANFDGRLRATSYADNATGLSHIDGYAGAYAPGTATYFNIVSSAGSNGSISPNGTTAVAQGASQTYTMTPNANYAVDSVYVDNVYAGALTSYSFTNVQATHTIRVVFKAAVVNYTITASATNGALISPNGATVVASGGSQAYTITANTGYHVYDIQVDGSSVGTSSPYTFSNVVANHTIQATGAINTYTLTASAGANGSISPSGVTTVNYGASQTFTITPNSGYHVSAVTVDGSGAGTPTSYTFSNVTANHTIAVTFAADAVTYTVTASANAGGTVTPGGATVWGAGTSPVYTIVPSDGYQLDDVLVDGVSVGTPTLYTFTSIGANHTISATFSLALTSYIITPSTSNGAATNPATATLVGSGMSKTFTIWTPDGTSPSVYVDGAYVGQVTSYTFSSVAANHTIFVTAVSTGGTSPTEGCECYRPQ